MSRMNNPKSAALTPEVFSDSGGHSSAPHQHVSSSPGIKGTAVPPAYELRIDELVLTGFSTRDRFHIADALERELARLLTEKGIAGLDGSPIELEGLDAGKFKVEPGARPHLIGRQAARALHGQLSQNQKSQRDRTTQQPAAMKHVERSLNTN